MKIHFLGIGGSGASAAAALAQAQGFEVTGCDLEPHNEFTTQFQPSQLLQGHSPSHIVSHSTLRDEPSGHSTVSAQSNSSDSKSGNVDILAVTPAIYSLDPNNPELSEAKKRNIPILTWQQFLGEYLTKNKFVIAVCGTHGKTTTTAMIAKVLEDAGLDPTVELGAIVPWWKANYRVGKGKLALSERSPSGLSLRVEDESNGYFVVEADEFNDNFLSIKPDISVVTNVEMDHPEYFKDFKAVKKSFKKFLESTKQTMVVNLSDPGVSDILLSQTGQMSHDRGSNVQYIDYSKYLIDFPLQIPGEFNRWNTSAAYQVGLVLGINPQVIQKSLATYPGIGRRFEYIGKFHEAEIYSDFGHHPTEIKVTMEAARQKFPDRRILLVYQPHMFSRTKALFDDFVTVFKQIPADKIFTMDIYPSREIDTGQVTAKQLVDAVNKPAVTYIGSTSQTLDKLKPEIQKGDVVFFMSAGDTDMLAKKLAKKERKYCILYIVRHGETDWNAKGKIQGESDIPLNNKGIKQVKALNKDLKDIKFNVVFSSDLVRAKITAEIIAMERKLAIKTTHLLRERRYGKLDGTPYHMMQEFHRIWENLSKKERVRYRPYGGYETDEEAISRFITFLREVAALYLGKTVLIVSHGGMMRTLLNHLSEETYLVGAIANSAYIKLESDGVDFFIKELRGIKNSNE